MNVSVACPAQTPRLAASRPPLAVYVVWHPEFAGGTAIADRIHAHLMGDAHLPGARAIDIPVYFRTPTRSAGPPAPIAFGDTRHTAVVILIDASLVAARDRGWGE